MPNLSQICRILAIIGEYMRIKLETGRCLPIGLWSGEALW